MHTPQFADNHWTDLEKLFSISNFFVEDELVVEVMKISIERLKDLMSSTTSPLEKKQLYFSMKNLKKQPTQRGNIFNDCQVYC